MPQHRFALDESRSAPPGRGANLGSAAARTPTLQHYDEVRARSLELAAPLSAEDQALQSMPDASPIKWHLAHTAWFFETMVLAPHAAGYRPLDARYRLLFNSYYDSVGPQPPRPQRHLLSRPSLQEVWAYRAHVDAAMRAFIGGAGEAAWSAAVAFVTLGLHHEQQHQELMLTDLKHAFSLNPLAPRYLPHEPPPSRAAPASAWLDVEGGIREIGARDDGFAFDNERPRHEVLLAPFRIAARPVNCGEYLAFMREGGYERPELWLSDGWACVQAGGWRAPLYWHERHDGAAGLEIFTLHGLRALDPAEPVAHLSFYEAAAYAEWAGARLPTEFEWESACAQHGARAPHAVPRPLHPVAAPAAPARAATMQHGEVWEWTRSAYAPYPGFRPLQGAAAEYNGKFMMNQMVLRGGSCVTPEGHARGSYRNFFPPAARWQFSGVRLAMDA